MTTGAGGDGDEAARRSGRPQLPEAQILSAATALIDSEGAHALTLRTLAARLGSSTATLYRHFENRSSLIDRVVDGVFGEVDLGDGTDEISWDTALTMMATSLFDALERHRNIAPLMLDRTRTASNAIRIRERVLRLLLADGFSAADAVLVYATIGRFVLGFGIQPRTDTRAFGTLSAGVELSSTDYPATAVVAAAGPVTLADEFQFGLAAIVLGVRARAACRSCDATSGGRAGVEGTTSSQYPTRLLTPE